ELVAFVSGDSKKLRTLSRKYKVKLNYSYDQYDALRQSGEIDAVYIVLPNSMHAEYAKRAAQQKIHVLCEKPMATTPEDCESMISAANENDIKLMIAYRLHFDPGNLAAVEMIKKGKIGTPKYFSSVFSFQVKEGNIRTQAELGGGTVWDIGIYCINAARYLFQSEPKEVFAYFAKSNDSRFED